MWIPQTEPGELNQSESTCMTYSYRAQARDDWGWSEGMWLCMAYLPHSWPSIRFFSSVYLCCTIPLVVIWMPGYFSMIRSWICLGSSVESPRIALSIDPSRSRRRTIGIAIKGVASWLCHSVPYWATSQWSTSARYEILYVQGQFACIDRLFRSLFDGFQPRLAANVQTYFLLFISRLTPLPLSL